MLDAEVISPDLSRGTAQFRRMNRIAQLEEAPGVEAETQPGGFVAVSDPDRAEGGLDDGEVEDSHAGHLGSLPDPALPEAFLPQEIDDAWQATA